VSILAKIPVPRRPWQQDAAPGRSPWSPCRPTSTCTTMPRADDRSARAAGDV